MKRLFLIVVGGCAITYTYAYFKLGGVFRLGMSIVFLLLFIKTSIEYGRTKKQNERYNQMDLKEKLSDLLIDEYQIDVVKDEWRYYEIVNAIDIMIEMTQEIMKEEKE